MLRTQKSCRCCALVYTGGPDRIAAHVLGKQSAGIQACIAAATFTQGWAVTRHDVTFERHVMTPAS